jgi:hypothetical protein
MNKENLKKELDKLIRSMNYIANNYLSKRKITPKKAKIFYAIYQQLGLLWEFLGCFCKHRDGYKKKDDKFLCKICGRVKETKENYYLLPVIGEKIIGRMVRPGKDKLKKLSKKEAEIVNDTIKFHGAKLNVSVFNGYISRLDKIGKEINIAADRVVTLEENRLVIEISKYIASMKIRGREKQMSVYGGFLWELPKKILKKMPIILSYNKHGKLVEIELLR